MFLRGQKLFVHLGQISSVTLAGEKKKSYLFQCFQPQIPYFRHVETFQFKVFKQRLTFCFCSKKIFLTTELILKGKR